MKIDGTSKDHLKKTKEKNNAALLMNKFRSLNGIYTYLPFIILYYLHINSSKTIEKYKKIYNFVRILYMYSFIYKH